MGPASPLPEQAPRATCVVPAAFLLLSRQEHIGPHLDRVQRVQRNHDDERIPFKDVGVRIALNVSVRIVDSGLIGPDGIAVYWLGSNIYWSDAEFIFWSTGDIDQDGPEPQPRQGRALHHPSYDRLPECAAAGVQQEYPCLASWANSQKARHFSTDVGNHRAIIRARSDGNERVELDGVTALALDQQSDIPCVSKL
ncbi:GL21080 [Drosophila persimilis]|uniref:GL21080 n=1 Tax=Drosophila persimilis TaxID=7234 RepID=B4GX15_DROPE|nr:GL21080 [Drosophila persimilis]